MSMEGMPQARTDTITDGVQHYYLHFDLSVQCAGAQYDEITAVARALILLWPIGVPLLLLGLLLMSRGAIVEQRPTKLSHATRVLHGEYRKGLFFWEIVEVMRKNTLMGFLLFIPQQFQMTRLLMAMLIIIGHVIILLEARPYVDLSTAYFATATNVCLLMTVLISIVLKVQEQLPTSVRYQLFGFSEGSGFVLLIVMTNVLIIGVAFVVLWYALHVRAMRPTLRLIETSREPELTLGPTKHYQIFVRGLAGS